MNKSKIIIVSLCLVIIGLGWYGVTSAMTKGDIEKKYEELTNKYDTVVNDYKELSNTYQDKLLNDAYSSPIVLEATASLIDNKAKVTVIDKVAYMYVPCPNDILAVKNKVEPYVGYIPGAIDDEYDSCIITAIDDSGKCVGGWTVLATGETIPFVSK